MTFYELIKACERAGSHAEIRRLLHQCKDNDSIKELFRLMLCPSIVYNIKKIPEAWVMEANLYSDDADLVKAIQFMLRKELRGKKLKDALAYIAVYATGEQRDVLSWVIDRKNPAKVGKSFVNAVWPGLVRTQAYMGAVPGSDEALTRLFNTGEPINCQMKEDGQTGLVDYIQGVPVSLHSRQGQRFDQYFPGFMAKLPWFDELPAEHLMYRFTGMVHHEILVLGEYGAPMDRAKGNGLINKQIKNGVVGGNLDNSLVSVLLDMKDDNNPGLPQDLRYSLLSYFDTPTSRRVEQRIFSALDRAREWAQNVIRYGGEGLVCKHPHGVFKNGKHWNNVKIKHEFTIELEVIDWKAHSTNPDLLGALLMASSDRKLQVWVNLKCDADRDQYGVLLVGDILQVKAEKPTTSKSNKYASLSLPRFDGDEYDEYNRSEKSEADSYAAILEQYKASKEGVCL